MKYIHACNEESACSLFFSYTHTRKFIHTNFSFSFSFAPFQCFYYILQLYKENVNKNIYIVAIHSLLLLALTLNSDRFN